MSDSIIKKPLTGILLLAGAAGGPYVLFETEAGNQARKGAEYFLAESGSPPTGTLTSSQATDEPLWITPGHDPTANPLNASTPHTSLAQAPVQSLQEVLRFDVTPAWVTARFPRISTVLADMQLDGLRVPLVTGTTPNDVAGTLTYYFDRYKRLQRISLHGVVGDPTRLIAELQQAYQLQQEPSLGGGLYLMKWNGQPTSVMQIAPAPVIRADAPYSRFSAFIELNQPGLEYGLSQEARLLIDSGRATNRW